MLIWRRSFDTGTYDSFLILYSAADHKAAYPLLENDLKGKLISGKQDVHIPAHKKEVTYEVFIFFLERYGEDNTDSLHLVR